MAGRAPAILGKLGAGFQALPRTAARRWAGLKTWFEERNENLDLFDETRTELARDNPLYVAGALTYFFWIVTIVTGLLLVMYYVPTTHGAFESVRRIQYEIPGFWLVRGLHKYGADAIIIALTVRIYRMYFTGEYKRPNELSWMIAVLMLTLAMFSGLTGYLLIWNQRAYWATKVIATFPIYLDAIPPFAWFHWGKLINNIMVGGAAIGQATITRFYMAHYAISMIAVILVEMHFYKKKLRRFNLSWTQMGLALGILVLLAIVLPPEMGSPANPTLTPHRIYSDWYFLSVYHLIRIFPVVPATLATLAIPLLAMAMPLLDRRPERAWYQRPFVTVVGIMALTYHVAFSILLILNIASTERDPPIVWTVTALFLAAGLLWEWFYRRSRQVAAPVAAGGSAGGGTGASGRGGAGGGGAR